jgi:Transmembrane secretion effector
MRPMAAMSQLSSPAPTRLQRLVPSAYRPALIHPVFCRLLPGLAISSLGDGMSSIAVAWLAIRIAVPDQRSVLVGVAVAAFTLPGALVGVTLSRVFGHRDGRLLLFLDSLLRAVALAAVSLLAMMGLLSAALYVVLLGLSSLLHAWGIAGRYSIVAELLSDEQRLAGNSLLTAMASAALILGPAAAGLILAVTSPAMAIGIDAASYAILGVVLAQTRHKWPTEDAVNMSITKPCTAGLRALVQHPVLIGLLALSFAFNLLYGPVEVALPIHVVSDLHATADVLGLFWTLFGIGAVTGGLTIGMARQLPHWPAVISAVAGWGAALLPLGYLHQFLPGLVAFGVGGLIYAPYSALSSTLLQRHSPPHMIAAIGAARGSILIVAQPLGTALGGPLVAAFGARSVIQISALTTIAVAGITGLAVLTSRARSRGTANIHTEAAMNLDAVTASDTQRPSVM